MDATETFAGMRLVPVVVLQDAEIAVPLAQTLFDAGVAAMEITLRTPQALAAIAAVAREVPDMVVGAGSIRRAAQVADVAAAGGQFLVSPGSSPDLLAAVGTSGLPFVPGAVSATEIMYLAEAGYELVKFFPAELSGGVAKLRALAAPLPETRFFPTGGITPELASDYLALPEVACVGGSWFVPDALLTDGRLDEIAGLAADAVALTGG